METYQTGTEQYIIRYDSVPVYANGSIYYVTSAGSYGYQGTLYNNSDTPIEANMAYSGWTTIGRGGVLNFGGQNTNGAIKMNGVQIWSGGIYPTGTVTVWSGNPKVQIGTTSKPVYGARPTYGTRMAWNTRWRKS